MDQADVKDLEQWKRKKSKAERNGNLKEEADYCNFIGVLYSRYGQYDEAIEEHERALSLSTAVDSSKDIALAIRTLGECYSKKGDFDKAIHLHQRYLDLARGIDKEEEQRALTTIGNTFMHQSLSLPNKKAKTGASRKAENAFHKSLAVCKSLKGKIKESEYADMLARLYFNIGLLHDNDETKYAEYLQKALDVSKKHGCIDMLFRCQCSLGEMYMKSDHSKAHRYLDLATATGRKVKDKQMESDALFLKAMLLVLQEDYSSARHLIKKAQKVGLASEGDVTKRQTSYKAVVKMEEACHTLQRLTTDDIDISIQMYDKLGDHAADLGKHVPTLLKQAVHYYTKMLELSESAERSQSELVIIHVSIAMTLKEYGQYDGAIAHYEQEIACRGDTEQEQEQVCRTWINIALIQEQCSYDYKKIQKSFVNAFNAAKRADHHILQVRSLNYLNELLKSNKDDKSLQQATDRLESTCRKYGISADIEEDSQTDGGEDDGGSDEGDGADEGPDMSDVTESEEEEEKISKTLRSVNRTGRTVRRTTVKLNAYGETPLHRACIEGELDRVKKLVAEGSPMNVRDNNGWTPLHEAANNDHLEITAYLIDHGSDINDRGGIGCNGLTPLIDAASVGNLEIMELLIEKGANRNSKDDKQLTALDHLIKCREESGEIDRGTELKFANMVQLLKEANPAYNGIARGNRVNLSQLTTSALVSSDTENHRESTLIKTRKSFDRNLTGSPSTLGSCEDLPEISRRRQSSVKKRRSRNDIIKKCDSSSDNDSRYSSEENVSHVRRVAVPLPQDSMETDESSQSLLINPRLCDLDPDHNPTEAYRKVISEVGRSASRSSQASQAKVTKKHRNSSSKQSALLAEDEIVDDWLEDDLRPSKRRKVDVEGYFTTGNIRNKTNSTSPNSPKIRKDSQGKKSSVDRKTKKNCIEDSDQETESATDEIIADLTTSVNNNSINGRAIDYDDDDDIAILFDDCDDIYTVHSPDLPSASGFFKSNNLRKSAPKQLKMTDFGQKTLGSRTTSSVSKNSSNARLSSQMSVASNQTPIVINGSQSKGDIVLSNREKLLSNVIKVKVKIQDKLLLIPIVDSEGTRTFSWLADEAATRYYKMYGLKPTLTLGTKDGAFFSPDDLVSLMISDNDLIEGFLQNWDMPPIVERYKSACKTLKTVVYKNVCTLLQGCETTGKLSLCDLTLRVTRCQPIIRALQHHTCLRDLDLRGNRLGDLGIDNLCKVLPTLPNLASLSLICNDITGEGLKHLQATVSKETDKSLQNLTHLELSYNPLYDSCLVQIAALVSGLPCLSRLGLVSCHLTVKFFQNDRLKLTEALHKSSVQHLDVSNNTLGSVGVELLLKCQNPTKLLSLDMSGSLSGHGSSHVYRHLYNYVSQDSCSIQELRLCHCHLTMDDTDFLIRLPVAAKQLQKLDISGNPKLTNQVLQQLIQSSVSDSSHLEELVSNECGVHSPLSVEFLDALSDKLGASVTLRLLKFTCFKLEKMDVDCLSQVWTEKWGDNSDIHYSGTSIRLSVMDR